MKHVICMLFVLALSMTSAFAQKESAPGQSCTMENSTAQAQCCKRFPEAIGCKKKCDPRLVKYVCPAGQTQDWENCTCIPESKEIVNPL